ncbi:GFA family protein [Pelagibacterium xiamenense]|uniref:GFA family protein n=1 Tax=Pelagibacterium xiamenense TaxID=2901140 RepID=UPI001E38F79B|nr:GFA family protein [Pelagibacterium xiamenense]MCD7059612.1 GFA family protein [Pelagibacterium xiamenense]
MMDETCSGGCQCGAVRYRFSQRPRGAHVCHCRMCQKAFGAFYAPLVGGPPDTFDVTRGEIAVFRSSDQAERGFCRDCGTPLTFGYAGGGGGWICVSIGSLDHPEAFPPKDQHGVESRLAWVNGIGTLPDVPATEVKDPETAAFIASTNHQHPDHDTDVWPHPRQST